MILSAGCKRSRACCSLAPLNTYAKNRAWVAVTGGTGKCGRMGTGCMMGLLDVSQTGELRLGSPMLLGRCPIRGGCREGSQSFALSLQRHSGSWVQTY